MFHVIKDERLVSEMEGKLILQGAYRPSGTGIAECLEIIDVGCNLKQFDGLTSLTLTPVFYDRSMPLKSTKRLKAVECRFSQLQ